MGIPLTGNNIEIRRTHSGDPDFKALAVLLDADLAERDGEDHSFYAPFNKVAKLQQVIVAYMDNMPVGCGAIRKIDDVTAEVKRMFVKPEFRGKGIAQTILAALEGWAAETGFTNCILETGMKQPEAIHLYKRSGYTTIPNYGQYAGVYNSVCMKKILK